jgi:hypothetical protein
MSECVSTLFSFTRVGFDHSFADIALDSTTVDKFTPTTLLDNSNVSVIASVAAKLKKILLSKKYFAYEIR